MTEEKLLDAITNNKDTTTIIGKNIKMPLKEMLGIIIFVCGLYGSWLSIHTDLRDVKNTIYQMQHQSISITEMNIWLLKAQLANKTNNVIFPDFNCVKGATYINPSSAAVLIESNNNNLPSAAMGVIVGPIIQQSP